MKIDIKTIIIILLLLISLFFCYKWYFSSDNLYKEKIDNLNSEYKKLEQSKKESDEKILTWKSKYDSLDVVDKNLSMDIKILKFNISKLEVKANTSKDSLTKISLRLKNAIKRINDFNPPNRTGDFLLESIKNKTK